MLEYIILGVIGGCLMALTSLFSYEMLRWTWVTLPHLKTRRHMRVLLLLVPIFITHIVGIWVYGLTVFLVSSHTD